MGCIRGDGEGEYRGLVKDFVSWSEDNNLQLNITKTKELVVVLWEVQDMSKPTGNQGGRCGNHAEL